MDIVPNFDMMKQIQIAVENGDLDEGQRDHALAIKVAQFGLTSLSEDHRIYWRHRIKPILDESNVD